MSDCNAENCLTHALLARTSDVVAILDGTGTLTYASPAAASVLGRDPEDLLGTNAFDLVHPDDQLDAIEGFESTMASSDSRATPLLLRLQHVTGAWIDTEIIATNHLDDPAVTGLVLTIRDVSASMRTEKSLRQSEERYRLIVELAHEGIFTVDERGTITYANRALAAMLRTTVADLLGHVIFDFMDDEWRTRAESYMRRRTVASDGHDFRLRAIDGTTVWVRVSANSLRLHDGRHAGVVAVVTDVTERRALEDRLAHDARHDALTGIPNRHTFFDELKRRLDQRTPSAVLFADLDCFKVVNDTHGHQIGDEVLRIAAQRISSSVRKTDVVARVGGDEFVVLCSVFSGSAEVIDLGARVVAAFDDPMCVGGSTVSATISVGLALSSGNDDADTMLARADHALYRAKRAGRNRLEIAATP